MENTEEKVIVYSTTWCGFCHAEMDWLKQQNVTFVAKDIEADKKAYDELLAKMGGNFQGVPVTVVNDGAPILGFDRPKISEQLKTNGLLAA